MDRDITSFNKRNKYSLGFYSVSGNRMVNYKAVKRRSEKDEDDISTDHYVLDEGFDYIQIHNSFAYGIVVPLFRRVKIGVSKFSFAVDFGTSNTHIEYSVDGKDPRPFDILEDDIQIVALHNMADPLTALSINRERANKFNDILVQELIPFKINKEQEYFFPLRSAISRSNKLELNTANFAMADLNLVFVYERYPIFSNSEVVTNLKWSNYTTGEYEGRIIDAYFENLLMLIRNKILLNGGDLNQTKFVWFYPSSMNEYRLGLLSDKWNLFYNKYITKTNVPLKLSESVAPFYYFNKKLGVSSSYRPAVSIDIGGGTTDVVIFKNNQPITLTSFKFAANSIFGDGYNSSPELNGFVNRYLDKIKILLADNRQPDLLRVLDDIVSGNKSEDIVSFFFSIQKNKRIKDNSIPISFSELLVEDCDLKIVFLIFYGSLVSIVR